jgi:hypothetical protein
MMLANEKSGKTGASVTQILLRALLEFSSDKRSSQIAELMRFVECEMCCSNAHSRSPGKTTTGEVRGIVKGETKASQLTGTPK